MLSVLSSLSLILKSTEYFTRSSCVCVCFQSEWSEMQRFCAFPPLADSYASVLSSSLTLHSSVTHKTDLCMCLIFACICTCLHSIQVVGYGNAMLTMYRKENQPVSSATHRPHLFHHAQRRERGSLLRTCVLACSTSEVFCVLCVCDSLVCAARLTFSLSSCILTLILSLSPENMTRSHSLSLSFSHSCRLT